MKENIKTHHKHIDLAWLKEAIESRRGEVTDSTLGQFNANMMKLRCIMS